MDKKFEDMSPEEKRTARFNTWMTAEGVEFKSPEAKAAYQERATNLIDAILMEKVPARVPIFPLGTFMQTNLYGVTAKECMYDIPKLLATHTRFLEDFQPDYFGSPAFIGSGKIYELLDLKAYRWSGRQLGDDAGYQYVEEEYMKVEDYPALIEDPSDFWLRTYLPRILGSLAPLSNIGSFTSIWEIVGVSGSMIPFGIPDVQKALQSLIDAGNEAMGWIQQVAGWEMTAKGMGFPGAMGGAAKAPYDMLSDTLRGTRGIMLDMYQRPDMILKAMERLTPIIIKQGVGMATQADCPIVFIPLHKGADGFMSDDQFKTFYWPTLKELIFGLCEQGCVPFLFCEGGYNSRLEYLKELPKGSCFWIFDRTDMVKAKEAVGDKLCIGGNVPAGLILTGTADEVKDYCRNLIDDVGKGGGYIMAFGTAMDEGKADTVHAMIDFTREYGVYQ
jgi:hypothetical protein